jgi:lipid-A-disaccharide synthase
MRKAGANLILDNSDLGVVGLLEVFRVLPKIFFAYHKILKFIKEKKPDILVLIDYPGFNVRLAKKVKNKGIKIVYYIPPIVWGRKGNRAKKIANLTDKIITFLPQDYEIYKKNGAKIIFVEHPLLKIVKVELSQQEIKERLSLEGRFPVVGILPGSRLQEIKNLLPTMLQAAEIIKRKYPAGKFLIPVAASYLKETIEKISKKFKIDLEIVENFTYEIMSVSDLLIVCSGTATLEGALLGIPMVIVYKVSKITEFVAKRVLEKYVIGMPNIILGENVVPELLQEDVNPEKISEICLQILEDENLKNRMKEKFLKIKELLKGEDAVSTTAEIILSEVN